MDLPEFKEVSIDKDKLELELYLNKKIPAFSGHFPSHPVLPGVVQLDWVMQLAARYFKISTPCAQNFRVKFQNIISAGTISLTIALDTAHQLLSFTYTMGDKTSSSGKIKLGSS